MVGVSRYRNKGGRRGGVEVAEVADVEEVVEAGVFDPKRHRRLRRRVEAEVVVAVGVAEVVGASNAGKKTLVAATAVANLSRRRSRRGGGGEGEVVATELKRWRRR